MISWKVENQLDIGESLLTCRIIIATQPIADYPTQSSKAQHPISGLFNHTNTYTEFSKAITHTTEPTTYKDVVIHYY